MRLLLLFLTILGRLSYACTAVDGDRITGADLAREHTTFLALDPHAELGPAPLAGAERVFAFFELRRVATEHGVDLPPGARPEACFTRHTVVLQEATLRPTLELILGHPAEIVDFSRVAVPTGRPEFLPTRLEPSGLWRGRWLYGEHRSIPIWVRIPARAAGSVEHPGARSVDAKPPPQAIARGDQVRVEVHSGAVLLAFDAAAESSGHTGEAVTVRNPANGQRFRAVVEGPGKVGIQK